VCEIPSLFIGKIICLFPPNCMVPKQIWWPNNPKSFWPSFFFLHF
jgi:hypothetical protein